MPFDQDVMDFLETEYPDMKWKYGAMDQDYEARERVPTVAPRVVIARATADGMWYVKAWRNHVDIQGKRHHASYLMRASADSIREALAAAITQYGGGWAHPESHRVWCMEQRRAQVESELSELKAKQRALDEELCELVQAIKEAE